MVRFIGIDYSTTSCGIAIVEHSERVMATHWQTFTVRSAPNGDHRLTAYYKRIQELGDDIMATIDPRFGDVVGIEGLAFAGQGGSVDRLHYAWHATVEYLSRVLHAELILVTPAQVKKLATGAGNANKDAVLLATERRVPQAEVNGNDEADAVWVAVGVSIRSGAPVLDLPAAHMPKGWVES